MADIIEIRDGIMTTSVGSIYFTPYQEHLVADILAGKGRLVGLGQLIEGLYQHPRDEPEWPDPTVKMHLSNARKKLKRVGLRLVNIANRGYRIEKEDA